MKTIKLRKFNQDESLVLKGIAILFIVFHNIYRHIAPVADENEFWFSPDGIKKFILILGADPREFVNVFFNFFGHYGVQAFIFISAYGITMSYLSKKPPYLGFIWQRLTKLYPAFLIAALVFILFTIGISKTFPDKETVSDLAIQLSLFSAFVPGKAMTITGPWWFYSFIFQFYLIFPLILYFTKRWGQYFLGVIAIIGIIINYTLYDYFSSLSLNPLHMVIGHLPEIAFGVWVAYKEETKLPVWIFLLALLLLIGANTYKILWPLGPVASVIVLVLSIQWFVGTFSSKNILYQFLQFIGVISMYLFATHGFLRLPFIELANNLCSPYYSFIIVLLFLAFSLLIAYMTMKLDNTIHENCEGFKITAIKKWIFPVVGFVAAFAIVLAFSTKASMKSKKLQDISIYQAFDKQLLDSAHANGDTSDWIKDSTSNNKVFPMIQGQSFSPGFGINLGKYKNNASVNIEFAAKTFEPIINNQFIYVIGVKHKKTGMNILWNGQSFEDFPRKPNIWNKLSFTKHIPKCYYNDDYEAYCYIWNNDGPAFIIDSISVEMKVLK